MGPAVFNGRHVITTNAPEVVERLLAYIKRHNLDQDQVELILTIQGQSEGCVEFDGKIIVSAKSDLTLLDFGQGNGSSPPALGSSQTSLLKPNWNGKELWFGDRVVKRFRNPGRNQQTVLSAFQEDGWPTCIANPIPASLNCDAQSRLHDTIKSLNRNHIPNPSPLKFRGDGTGAGVRWEVVS